MARVDATCMTENDHWKVLILILEENLLWYHCFGIKCKKTYLMPGFDSATCRYYKGVITKKFGNEGPCYWKKVELCNFKLSVKASSKNFPTTRTSWYLNFPSTPLQYWRATWHFQFIFDNKFSLKNFLTSKNWVMINYDLAKEVITKLEGSDENTLRYASKLENAKGEWRHLIRLQQSVKLKK